MWLLSNPLWIRYRSSVLATLPKVSATYGYIPCWSTTSLHVVKIPLNVTHKFGNSYLAMDMCDINRLVEWVQTMRRKVTTAGKAAFEL